MRHVHDHDSTLALARTCWRRTSSSSSAWATARAGHHRSRPLSARRVHTNPHRNTIYD
jgi:hypothetical protein